MHPRQQKIVAHVVEVRYAAFCDAEILDWCRQIDGGEAAPHQTYRRFYIEVEAAHPAMTLHDIDQRRDWIDAESIEAIGDAASERVQRNQAIGDLASENTHARCLRTKYRFAENQRLRRALRGPHERFDQRSRMLPVGVHGEGMRIAG